MNKSVALFLALALIIGSMLTIALIKSPSTNNPVNKVFPISAPVETEAEYISTTKAISDNQKKGVYYKEFLKNPTKFKGSRISVIGKIFNIEESEGQSALQVYITGRNDNVVVYYKGTTEFYKDDFVRIYGEGGGIFEGKNAFGATITVPIINAKYLKKVKSDE